MEPFSVLFGKAKAGKFSFKAAASKPAAPKAPATSSSADGPYYRNTLLDRAKVTAGPTLSKISSGVGKMSSGAGNIFSGAANTAGAAGAAVQGAAWSTASQGVGSAFDAVKDPGFVLFIAGLLTWVFKIYNNPVLAILLGTVFLFFSAFYLFKGKSIITITVFWVTYTFVGKNADLQTVLYYFGASLLIGMLIHGTFARFKKESFVGGAAGELALGAIPIVVFLLDLGLLEKLILTFNFQVPAMVGGIMLFTPWWALLGIFTTKKENTLVSIFKFLALVYIFFILTVGVVPSAYGAYKSGIPGPEELLQAKQELAQQMPQKESPAWSNIWCLVNDPTNSQACVQQRQELSEMKWICEKRERLKSGTSEFEECLKTQKENKEKEKIIVAGVNDPTIKKPTKVEWVKSKYFPETDYHQPGGPYKPYPLELVIENPRRQQFGVEVSCSFANTKNKEAFPGIVKGGTELSGSLSSSTSSLSNPTAALLTINSEKVSKSIICSVPEGKELNGKYTINYTAVLKGLNTKSRLARAFIGTKDEKWKEENLPKILSAHFPGTTGLSQAPADLARLNFGFGNNPDNPIIEGDTNLILSAMIEDGGKGKILAINSYRINLEGFGVDDSEAKCLQGLALSVKTTSKYSQDVYIPSCFITTLPSELANPSAYEFREFEGEINYDYLLTKDVGIEVKLLES